MTLPWVLLAIDYGLKTAIDLAKGHEGKPEEPPEPREPLPKPGIIDGVFLALVFVAISLFRLFSGAEPGIIWSGVALAVASLLGGVVCEKIGVPAGIAVFVAVLFIGTGAALGEVLPVGVVAFLILAVVSVAVGYGVGPVAGVVLFFVAFSVIFVFLDLPI